MTFVTNGSRAYTNRYQWSGHIETGSAYLRDSSWTTGVFKELDLLPLAFLGICPFGADPLTTTFGLLSKETHCLRKIRFVGPGLLAAD